MEMMLQLLGVLSLVGALAALVMHMRTSYATQGGREGQNPCVAAAAIQVPLLTMTGLALLDKTTLHLDLPWWHWLSIWLAETIVVTAATIRVGEVAYRRARSDRHGKPTLNKGA
jgi:hypothetical protein